MKHDTHHRHDEEQAAAGPDATAGGSDAAASEAAESDAAAPPADAAIDYKDRWLRVEAELQTFRRRARREVEDARRMAEEAILLDLVSWLDDLERAVEAAKEGGANPSWLAGVGLVLQKGREHLERQGVVAVDPMQQPFDPHFHEAILEVDAPPETVPGTVVQVIHKGYRRGARALRAARVVVARASAGES